MTDRVGKQGCGECVEVQPDDHRDTNRESSGRLRVKGASVCIDLVPGTRSLPLLM